MGDLATSYAAVRWQDIVDIALNSYILFRFYVLFRDTNAFRVLLGITLLWFLNRISFSFGLIVTSWAFQGITAVGALIIIVVFRNEIRSVLQVRDLRALLWELHPKASRSPVGVMADSVFALSRTYTGALIVLPGMEEIDDVVHSGIPWDGKVSREMLMTIFWTESPVHDGAVIIQDDRVKEVGAILPLSQRQDFPSYYGTRHRAAAGLSEAKDALVVAVSEERGTVTVAKNSHMATVSRKEQLEEMIMHHLEGKRGRRTYPGKEYLELGTALLLSFFIITGVWYSFTRGRDTTVAFDVPIEYINRSPAVAISNTSTNELRVFLSGSRSLIQSVRPEQLRARIDMTGTKEGLNIVKITEADIEYPPGLALKEIHPEEIEVLLDAYGNKTLPVQVDWTGKLPGDLNMEKVTVAPDKVVITGPKKILEQMYTLYTEKVPLDGLKKSGKITARIVLDPVSLTLAQGSKDTVTIEYVLAEKER
ncbi:MAG: DNA integrity scanning protein DisA nucleotide-binding domain protein [Deltaproteobacteria bacterium]|nr:DNA integrity scanning protein DisA nucleotide-binding domain protein [Deltaproteobacteria bacterium]